jgi:glycosyltransferase involved in cell wall biosynthesis
VKVLLVGNYGPDRQESMLRYAALLHEGLSAAGVDAELAVPEPVLNRGRASATGPGKWSGYLDKYLLGTGRIKRLRRKVDVVHVCDHSNAVYVPRSPGIPHVVTCHDLLAVRGALGEATDCPATATGRILQRRILGGLRRAQAIACVSRATMRDAQRLLHGYAGRLGVVPIALNQPLRRLEPAEWSQRLAAVPALRGEVPYVLHVGSNLRRKNRETLLDAFGLLRHRWPGLLVMAGEALTAELVARAIRLGVRDRIVEVPKPDSSLLEALYNGAVALVFPSRYEGFGWPVIEAQACGCPVICSDLEPLPEVAGTGALYRDADDAAGFADAIEALYRNPSERERLAQLGSNNVAAYGRDEMVGRFTALYRDLVECR